MKHLIFILTLLISACTQVSKIDVLSSINSSVRNKDCMNMTRFEVLQVVEDGHALAFECNSDSFCSSNTVVLLTPQKGIDYYDDMIVELPNKKCAVQDGVYRYETKDKRLKTVPVIRYDYEYAPKDDAEKDKRFYETMSDLREGCKASMAQDKKTNNSKSMKKCDCYVDAFITTYQEVNHKTLTDAEKDKITENTLKNTEKKCGKMPEYFLNI